MNYMTIKYLEGGGTICEVHGINSKTCKRSKRCIVTAGTTPKPKELASRTVAMK